MCRLAELGWTKEDDAYRQFFTTQFLPAGTRRQGVGQDRTTRSFRDSRCIGHRVTRACDRGRPALASSAVARPSRTDPSVSSPGLGRSRAGILAQTQRHDRRLIERFAFALPALALRRVGHGRFDQPRALFANDRREPVLAGELPR